MATLAMPPRRLAPAWMPVVATPQEIISSARSAPAGMTGALVATGISSALLWAAFTPLDLGPLAWFCLTPFLALARLPRAPRRMYLAVYLGGLLFWLPALQWMRLGHPAMYAAWGALAFYLAVYFPLFLALLRTAVWRFGVPLTLAAPVLWVGLELLRAHLLTGFSWYYLGHTQHRWIELIQVSDLVGAYGVSFLPALVGACLAELLPIRWLERLRLLPALDVTAAAAPISHAGRLWRVALCAAVFAAALGYGYYRRSGVEFQSGPLVALIQGNVPSEVKHDQNDWPEIQQRHETLTGLAVRQQPDLIVWPETMFRWPLLETPRDLSDEDLAAAHPHVPFRLLRQLGVRKKLAQMSDMSGAAMVIGLETVEADRERVRSYNSAVLVRPGAGLAGRYDKLHRVPFGEFIPLAESLPWLHNFTPFGPDFGIDRGRACAVFEHNGSRFAPIICFEDTVPHLVREIVNVTAQRTDAGSRRIDFLVNITNDGWFHGSSELDQHLITAAFRCVECRTPMVRAVNTGISAIIDGDGVVRQRARGTETARGRGGDRMPGDGKQEEAVVVGHVPLDARSSLYLAGGDWFAGACLVACSFLGLMGLAGRFLGIGSRERPC